MEWSGAKHLAEVRMRLKSFADVGNARREVCRQVAFKGCCPARCERNSKLTCAGAEFKDLGRWLREEWSAMLEQ